MQNPSAQPIIPPIRIAYVASVRGQKTYGAFAAHPTLQTTVYEMARQRTRADNLRLFWRVARSVFSTHRPHVIVWDTFAIYVLPVMWLARRRGVRNLLRLRGNTLRELDSETRPDAGRKEKFTVWLQRFVTRQAMQIADCLLPVADHIAVEMLTQEHLANIPHRALPTFVDVERFKPLAPHEQTAMRRELGLASSEPILLTLTNFDYWEKVEPLLAFLPAFERLATTYPRLRWLIGGKGKHHTRFVNTLSASSSLEQVTILNWIANPVDYLQVSDMLVHFSKLEGLPNVVIEAAACGKPVIANPYSGLQDCIIDGETGFLVEPANHVATARTVCDYFDDPLRQAKMGQAARTFAQDNFAPAAVADRFIAILAELGVKTSVGASSNADEENTKSARQATIVNSQ